MNGYIQFNSNNLDQSDGFLQEVVIGKLFMAHVEGFEILGEELEDLTFHTEYEFTADSESDLLYAIREPNGMNDLIEQTPEIRKYYPKEQFNCLTVVVSYKNKTDEDVSIEAMLKYNAEKDTLKMTILDAMPY